MNAIQVILGTLFGVANIGFWLLVHRREARFRAYVERTLDVTITLGGRGHWKVSSDHGSWFRNAAIGWLQLAYYMAAYVAWAIALLSLYGVMAFAQRK
jgi:hypothetical protein